MEKPNTEISFPWVGSYFGIPLPDHLPEAESFAPELETEIHVLLKDLTVIKYRLQIATSQGGKAESLPQDLSNKIRNIAWEHTAAIAMAWYVISINPTTGARTVLPPFGANKCIRVGKLEWRYVFSDGHKGPRYTPSVVESRYRYAEQFKK